MSDYLESQKSPKIKFPKLFHERIDKVNSRRELTHEETKCLSKLEEIS